MESSLREQVREQITEYSDLVKKYFAALSAVAEGTVIDADSRPEQVIRKMALVDEKLQKAVEHSKSFPTKH